MKMQKGFITIIAVSFILLGFGLVFAQQPAAEIPIGQTPNIPVSVENEPEMQWLWGEVTNLDLQNRMILVKYLDYETDQEKEATISVDDKTTYENIKSIEELKQNDPVSVDYIITPEGKNIARIISLEKPEENTAVPEEAVKNLGVSESSEESPQQ